MKVAQHIFPSSLEEAYQLQQASPKNKVLAGGLWLKKGNADCDTLIDLSKLGLDYIKDEKDYVAVGAMVSERAFELSPVIQKLGGGVLARASHEILGPAFRGLATVGGSVYGKYGFSDLVTALLGFKVELEFYPENVVALEDYLKTPGFGKGILKEIRIYKENVKAFFKKVKETAIDYPMLNVCVTKGKEYRLVVGSRPLVATRLEKAAEYLNEGGKDIDKAVELALEELKVADSTAIRGDYRAHLAKVYLTRALEEVK